MIPGTLQPHLRLLAATVIVGLGSQLLLNTIVNPMAYYPGERVRPIAWSTRVLRERALAHCDAGVIAMGSSRTMKVAPTKLRELTGKSAYNASVDSAMTEDYLALLRLARAGCPKLDDVVLGIDVEAFHDHREPDPRGFGGFGYWQNLPAEDAATTLWSALEKSVAFEQTNESIRSLRLLRRGDPPPISTFDADGLIHYTEEERAKAQGTFTLDAQGIIPSYLARFANYQHLSAHREAVFEQFLAEAEASGIRVHAFITPLHRELLTALRTQRDFDARHAEVAGWLAAIAPRHPNFSVVDFSEVSSFGGAEDGFVDGAHIDDENSARLLERLYGGAAHAVQ